VRRRLGLAVALAALLLGPAIPAPAAVAPPRTPASPPVPFPSWETFLQRQYRDVLDRSPDAESQPRWLGRLRRGEKSPAEVVDELLRTPPTAATFRSVIRLWAAALARPPTIEELVHWSRALRGGGSLADAAGVALADPSLSGLGDDGFVEHLYDTAFGRAPDDEGRRHWVDLLASGRIGRAQGAVALADSPEFRERSSSRVLSTLVRALLLRRPPTTTELVGDRAVLAGGLAALVDEVLRSVEYRTRAAGLCAPGSLRYCRRTAASGEPDELSSVPPYLQLLPASTPAGWTIDRAYTSATPLGYRPGLTTLYGDPDLADPLTGPTLAVGETFDDFPVPGASTPGFHSEVVDGRTVAVGTDRAWSWATWSEGGTCECVAFVAGRNVGEAAVLAAARHVSDVFARPTIDAVGLPPGVEALVAAPVDPELSFLFDSERLEYRGTGTSRVTISVTKADPRFLWLVRFWIAGGEAAGVVPSVEAVDARYEDGHVIVGTGQGVLADVVRAFTASLRPAPPGSWSAARLEARDRADFLELCSVPGAHLTVIEGTAGQVRWGVVFGDFECEALLAPGRASDLVGGGTIPDSGPGELSMFGGTYSGGQAHGTLVTGNAPAGTAAVLVLRSDGRRASAVLGDAGRRPGERYYGTFFPESSITTSTLIAIAFDAAGRPLALRSS
jgi:hypothetical protein